MRSPVLELDLLDDGVQQQLESIQLSFKVSQLLLLGCRFSLAVGFGRLRLCHFLPGVRGREAGGLVDSERSDLRERVELGVELLGEGESDLDGVAESSLLDDAMGSHVEPVEYLSGCCFDGVGVSDPRGAGGVSLVQSWQYEIVFVVDGREEVFVRAEGHAGFLSRWEGHSVATLIRVASRYSRFLYSANHFKNPSLTTAGSGGLCRPALDLIWAGDGRLFGALQVGS